MDDMEIQPGVFPVDVKLTPSEAEWMAREAKMCAHHQPRQARVFRALAGKINNARLEAIAPHLVMPNINVSIIASDSPDFIMRLLRLRTSGSIKAAEAKHAVDANGNELHTIRTTLDEPALRFFGKCAAVDIEYHGERMNNTEGKLVEDGLDEVILGMMSPTDRQAFINMTFQNDLGNRPGSYWYKNCYRRLFQRKYPRKPSIVWSFTLVKPALLPSSPLVKPLRLFPGPKPAMTASWTVQGEPMYS